MERLYHSSTEQHRSGFTHEEVRLGAGDCLEVFESIDRVTQPGQDAPPLTQQLPQLPQGEPIRVGRREGRGLHRRRRHVEHDTIELPQPPPEPTEGTYYVTPPARYDDFTSYSYMSQHDGSSQFAHPPHDYTPSCHGFDNVPHEPSLSLGQGLSGMNQSFYVPDPPVTATHITPPFYHPSLVTPPTPQHFMHPWQDITMLSPASGGVMYRPPHPHTSEPPGLGFNLNEAFNDEATSSEDHTDPRWLPRKRWLYFLY